MNTRCCKTLIHVLNLAKKNLEHREVEISNRLAGSLFRSPSHTFINASRNSHRDDSFLSGPNRCGFFLNFLIPWVNDDTPANVQTQNDFLLRLGYCFTPYQRLWLYNGAPLVAFYDTLGIRRTYSRLKPPASSRGGGGVGNDFLDQYRS